MEEKKITGKLFRATQAQFTPREVIPEFFVEGVADAVLGIPISKLTFHTADGFTPEGVEKRSSVVRLVIPTASLLEMCRNVLANSSAVKDQLSMGYDLSRQQMERILDGVNVTPINLGDAPAAEKG